jgi:hypothetical protein
VQWVKLSDYAIESRCGRYRVAKFNETRPLFVQYEKKGDAWIVINKPLTESKTAKEECEKYAQNNK